MGYKGGELCFQRAMRIKKNKRKKAENRQRIVGEEHAS